MSVMILGSSRSPRIHQLVYPYVNKACEALLSKPCTTRISHNPIIDSAGILQTPYTKAQKTPCPLQNSSKLLAVPCVVSLSEPALCMYIYIYIHSIRVCVYICIHTYTDICICI